MLSNFTKVTLEHIHKNATDYKFCAKHHQTYISNKILFLLMYHAQNMQLL